MNDHSTNLALLKKRLRWPLAFVASLWIVHLTKIFLGWDLGFLGVLPQTKQGLIGIFTAPFIHGDLPHLISNTIPLVGMLLIMVLVYPRVAFKSFMLIYVLTGISVWIFGRKMVFHIGASGVVYGLVAFVFWSGVFRRSMKSIVLALIMVVIYTPMFAGIFPNKEGVSWESHLLGAIMGVFTSFYFKQELEVDEMEESNHIVDPEMEAKAYFFPRDVFEKTKAERAAEQLRNSQNWMSDTSL